jgi:hypothetical protein
MWVRTSADEERCGNEIETEGGTSPIRQKRLLSKGTLGGESNKPSLALSNGRSVHPD